MRLHILLCDRFEGILPEYIPSCEAMFTSLFKKNCPEMTTTVHDVTKGLFPEETDKNDICLITGCNRSVYDDVEWIRRLTEWIRAADRRGTNIVGICFGHQAIAQALGGTVERARNGWGAGIRESVVTGNEALRHFPSGRMRLMYNHHDQVTAPPTRATVFAKSDFCPVDGFTIGRHIITFQGHPEYIPQYAVHLIMDFADDEPVNVRREALRSIGNMQHDGDIVAKWIYSRFAHPND